ncbi:MAG: PilN domain-containing protein [Magnetococcales bacterium]|nr:PilN domain-containing protein [Magnetococcales bacterium]
MAEIDLIPHEYRRQLLYRRWFSIFVPLFLIMIVIIAFGSGELKRRNQHFITEIERLGSDIRTVMGRKTDLERLKSEEQAIQNRIEQLNQLRKGLPIRYLFLAIDRSLNGGVWFLDWSFQKVETEEQSPISTLLDAAKHTAPPAKMDPSRFNTMTIHGQALDHTALSDFVRRLTMQPLINHVRIVKTNHADDQDLGPVVGFELTLFLMDSWGDI